MAAGETALSHMYGVFTNGVQKALLCYKHCSISYFVLLLYFKLLICVCACKYAHMSSGLKEQWRPEVLAPNELFTGSWEQSDVVVGR